MLVVGSVVWAYVIGSICGIIATMDPATTQYQTTMDELNYMMVRHADSNRAYLADPLSVFAVLPLPL